MTITAETPAQGISTTMELDDFVQYKCSCMCDHADDDMYLTVELDEFNHITVNMDVTLKTNYWNKLVNDVNENINSIWLSSIDSSIRSIINGLYQRVCLTKELWFNGYVKTYYTLALNEQRARNVSAAITNTCDKLNYQVTKKGQECQN